MSVANFNTSYLIKHLKTRDAKEHNEFTKAKGKKKNELQQQTLETAFQRRDKFPKDSHKETKITNKIWEFIFLDDQPVCRRKYGIWSQGTVCQVINISLKLHYPNYMRQLGKTFCVC